MMNQVWKKNLLAGISITMAFGAALFINDHVESLIIGSTAFIVACISLSIDVRR